MPLRYSAEKAAELREIMTKYGFPPEYPPADPSDMILLNDESIDWESMEHKTLTCVNHPWSRYSTKNPWSRSLFLIQGPQGLSVVFHEECDCPFSDLRVLKSKGVK